MLKVKVTVYLLSRTHSMIIHWNMQCFTLFDGVNDWSEECSQFPVFYFVHRHR